MDSITTGGATPAAKASAQRKIEEAEQQLWELTGSDQPDATKMDAKVREVEKLRGDQRMAFIQSVGESAQVLTDEQRKILIGQSVPLSGVNKEFGIDIRDGALAYGISSRPCREADKPSRHQCPECVQCTCR